MKADLSQGYIKLFRSLLDWEWYQDSGTVHLMIHLILKANYQPGEWQGIKIQRGQLVTSLDHLSYQTGMSLQEIRTRLNRLKRTNEITIVSTNRYSLITICNYGSYQDEITGPNKPINSPTNSLSTDNQQSNNNQLTTNKNDKKNKKERNTLLKEEILKNENSKIFFHTLAMKYQVKKEDLAKIFDEFYAIKYLEKSDEFNMDQVKDHFANWLPKNVKKGQQNVKKSWKKPDPDQIVDNR